MIAAVLGLSPWHSPLDAYLAIVEGEEEISDEKRRFFDDRKDLEPWARKKFERRTGLELSAFNQRYTDAEFPWAKAEIDFELDFHLETANGETKTVRSDMAWLWPEESIGEEPPLYVTAQAMWGLSITGRNLCYVHALIGFDEDRVYEIARDEALITDIRTRAAAFWDNHVAKRRPPQPTTLADLKRLYSRDTGRSVEASREVIESLEQRSRAKGRMAMDEKHCDLSEFEIKAFMRDATTLTVRGKSVATWKARADGVRVFRTF